MVTGFVLLMWFLFECSIVLFCLLLEGQRQKQTALKKQKVRTEPVVFSWLIFIVIAS